MTKSIDTFLIDHGFEADELARIKHRNFLYLAIITVSFLAVTFVSLAANAWF